MRKLIIGIMVILMIFVQLPMNHVFAATPGDDYYYPQLKDIYFASNQELSYGDTMQVYAKIDNNGYEVSKISLQMKNTSSMATFVIKLSYNSQIDRWVGQRKIDEPSWLGSDWLADYIIIEDNNGHLKSIYEYDRYYIDPYFNWSKLQVDINPPAVSNQVIEKNYQGTVWKDRVVDLTSDYTNNGTLIIENSTIKSNGYKFINNGVVILKGKNTFYMKDGWEGYRGYGELILNGPWFHEIGIDETAKPQVNRVTNKNYNTITGYGEIGAEVTVYSSDRTKIYGTGTVDKDMRFSIPISEELKGGTFGDHLYLTMKGQAPKEGYVYADIFDVIPPSITNSFEVNELTTKLKGSTNENSTIFIKKDYNSPPIAKGGSGVGINENFSIDIPKQEAGTQLIIEAIDHDGNKSDSKFTVAAKSPPTELTESYSESILYAENGPYIINGKVNFTNSMIVVEPGVEFIAKKNVTPLINIEESLIAYARDDAPITFNEVPVSGEKAYFKNVNFLNLNKNINTWYMRIQEMVMADSKVINSNFDTKRGQISNSTFLNSPLSFSEYYLGYSQGASWTRIEHSTFVRDSQELETYGRYYRPLLNIDTYDERSIPAYAIKNNSFITPEEAKKIITFSSEYRFNLDLTNNYWGTTDLSKIKNDKLGGVANILVDPMLKDHHAETKVYELPSKLEIEPINLDDRIIWGVGSSGNTAKITVDNYKTYTVQINRNGTFSYQIPINLTLSSKVQARQIDENGLEGDLVEVKVFDSSPPAMPLVNEVPELSEEVSGHAEASSTINIYKNGNVIGNGTVTKTGEFSVVIPKQEAGTKLTVTATDEAGNVSPSATVTVLDKTAPLVPKVNAVSDQSKEVTGTAEPGATITARSGTKEYKAIADLKGNFKVAIAQQKAGTKLTVTATDESGNVSESATVTVLDKTAPAVPKVNAVTDQSIEIAGTAEPGSTIIMKIGIEEYTAVVTEIGEFSVIIPQQKAGTKLIVNAIDGAGNVSESTTIIVLDKTAPMAPRVNVVTDQSKEVSGTVEIGSNTTVTIGTKVYTATPDLKGNFKVAIAQQKAGTKLTVTATDGAGNVSKSTTVTVKDVTPPVIQKVNTLSNLSTSVTGVTEGKVEVKLEIGSKNYIVTADAKGNFNIAIPKQKADTVVKVTVTDKFGNVSPPKMVKVIDKTAPVVPSIGSVTDQSTSISGKTEAYAVVKLYIGGKYQKSVTADKYGSYKISIPKQKAGMEIKLTATDKSGNTSAAKVIKVSDKTPPAVPTVGKVTSKTIYIKGNSEKSSIVYVYNGKSYLEKATTNSKGQFSIKIKAQKKGSTLSVYAKDSSGNTSAKRSFKVY